MKELIRESGMTQKAIADKLGISRVAFTYKLNGKYPFTFEEVKKLCKILKLTDFQILLLMKEED